MQTTLDFMVNLAQDTGQLLRQHFRRAGLQSQLKADRSIVTEADLAADHLISAAILARYPQDRLLSEELQPNLAELDSGQVVWIVDPIDGTSNFSLGLQVWGVVIARLVGGQPQQSVLYFPWIEELYTAERGQGAYFNGERIYTHAPSSEVEPFFFSCCSRTFRRYDVRVPYKPRILGSAAYSLSLAARGVALLSFEATPKIWDIAAAWLLVEEAGGVIATLDGSQPFPLSPGPDYARQNYPCLAAATGGLLAKGQAWITPKPAAQAAPGSTPKETTRATPEA